jgi:hypothetical protein
VGPVRGLRSVCAGVVSNENISLISIWRWKPDGSLGFHSKFTESRARTFTNDHRLN